ncbi:MAG: hypothetical protein GWM87_10820 [Xanthomonadales bacterium]|nr:response regulator transcription factor [Xanthomonadales bacterium]NIX13375.1 hypothetical protein [Xanthomonadales bacterium]
MAIRHKSVKRTRLKLRTSADKLEDFTISALVLYDEPGSEILINLCRKDRLGDGEGRRSRDGRKSTDNGRKSVLTPRETEVLKCLAEGHSTREVATMLSISVPTVRNHVEHMLHKLHAHSRLEAVAVARRLGII